MDKQWTLDIKKEQPKYDTYKVSIRCRNCGGVISAHIKLGVRVQDVVDEIECPKCKCNIMASTKNNEEAQDRKERE